MSMEKKSLKPFSLPVGCEVKDVRKGSHMTILNEENEEMLRAKFPYSSFVCDVSLSSNVFLSSHTLTVNQRRGFHTFVVTADHRMLTSPFFFVSYLLCLSLRSFLHTSDVCIFNVSQPLVLLTCPVLSREIFGSVPQHCRSTVLSCGSFCCITVYLTF